MTKVSTTDRRDVYQLDKLMEETRSLASKYREATGQTLPVSHDLACYDAIRLLGLASPEIPEASIDAVSTDEQEQLSKYTIKGRVEFPDSRGKQQRIGQLNMDSDWNVCLVVTLDETYSPTVIYGCDRARIEQVMKDRAPNKRGAMTLAQFRKIAQTVWSYDDESEQAVNPQ